jgi:Insect cuticle protein
MFKLISVAVALSVICSALADATATVLSNTFADDGAGNFNTAFETSNGIKQAAQGSLKDISVPITDGNGVRTGDQPGKGETQQGSFSFTAPDGQVYTGKLFFVLT